MRGRRYVFIGLTLSSSWGNGHATTYRALLRGLAARGAEVDFIERDAPWYAAARDLAAPDFCRLHLHDAVELAPRFGAMIAAADAVVVGSYVPDGVAVSREALRLARGPVAFYDIDTPVTLAALEAGSCAYLTPELVGAFDVYLSFAGGPTLRALERRWGARRAEALFCAADAERHGPTGGPARYALGYLGTYSADRQPALERLLLTPARLRPGLRFVVAGPQYPAGIDWPANVERIEHVPPEAHPAFYGSLGYALNVTRADMRRSGWAPSVRLFEASACGAAVITDRWPGLGDFFPEGEAIVAADGPDEVLAALDAGPARRRRIAAAARRLTLERHTGAVRAAEFEAVVAAARHGRRAAS
jgi:spore maturation protein CgeB